jgi:DNA-binding CsgD family transcriptional regulator
VRKGSGPAVDCGAANQPARRTTPDNEHLLTSRELTIAQLAAAPGSLTGSSPELFISEKTVEYHLGKGVHQAQRAVANPAHVQTPRRANGHAARSHNRQTSIGTVGLSRNRTAQPLLRTPSVD